MESLLVLNTGSSSVKFRLFSLSPDLPLLAGGKVSDIGGNPVFEAEGKKQSLKPDITHEKALDAILDWLGNNAAGNKVAAVAHRIVHAGERYTNPVLLTPEAMKYLHSLSPLAPLHQPHNLAAVNILSAKKPGLKQYGCFDTAFHARHEKLFYEFALPGSIRNQGVRRYGFHGLSYDWIAHCLRRNLPSLLPKRVVVAHLGNGASLCAMKDGKSIDTTMGMTALDGLPMGTRCGSLDPGALLYILHDLGYSIEKAEKMLYEDSGLKGLSGISNDVKTLSESESTEAKFALDYFILKTAQHIATMAVSIGGLDALIFTGGIGENANDIRLAIESRLSFLPEFETHVIPANEERIMAQEIWENFGKDFG